MSIEAIAKVVSAVEKVKETKELDTIKSIGKETSKGVTDFSKRIDVANVGKEIKESGIDFSKRIVPEKVELSGLKELSDEAKSELKQKGMSEGILKDVKQKADGTYYLKTRNSDLVGEVHPETKVPYINKTVDIWGAKLDGVYAKFQSEFTTFLPNDLLLASDAKQFKYCMDQLKNAIENSPELRNKFSPRQLEEIEAGKKPSRFSWNHNEEVGKMELVNEKDHAGTPHTGGRAIWGGGDECRRGERK